MHSAYPPAMAPKRDRAHKVPTPVAEGDDALVTPKTKQGKASATPAKGPKRAAKAKVQRPVPKTELDTLPMLPASAFAATLAPSPASETLTDVTDWAVNELCTWEEEQAQHVAAGADETSCKAPAEPGSDEPDIASKKKGRKRRVAKPVAEPMPAAVPTLVADGAAPTPVAEADEAAPPPVAEADEAALTPVAEAEAAPTLVAEADEAKAADPPQARRRCRRRHRRQEEPQDLLAIQDGEAESPAPKPPAPKRRRRRCIPWGREDNDGAEGLQTGEEEQPVDVPMGSEATRGEAGSPDDLAESVPESAAPEALAVGSEGTPAAVAQAPGDLLEPGGGPGNLSESVPAPAAPEASATPGVSSAGTPAAVPVVSTQAAKELQGALQAESRDYKNSQGAVLEAHSQALGLPAGKLANSSSHPREWAAFVRAASGRKAYVKELAPYMRDDKTDLFNVWLTNNRDVTSCLLTMQRRSISRSKSGKGWGYARKSLLAGLGYTPSQVEALVAARTKDGRWVADEDFPNDPEMRWYWVRTELTYQQEDIQEQEDEVTAKSDIRPEDAMHLGGSNGLFNMPAIPPGMQEDSAKAFHAELYGWAKCKPRKTGKPNDGKPSQVAPTTPKEKAFSLKNRCLAEKTFADKAASGLVGDPLSEPIQELMQRAGLNLRGSSRSSMNRWPRAC